MALNTRIGPAALAAALGLAALAGGGSAHAAVTCSSVVASLPTATQAHVIYGSGGSAITPTLAEVAYVLSQSSTPIFVFYQDAGGAQAGYESFKTGTGGTTARPFKYWLTASDVTGTAPTCTADVPGTGRAVDFATTGGTLALFDGETLDADTGVFTGPTQGVNIVVPKDSTETSLSAEALFYVYGFGDASQFTGATDVIPWTTKDYIFERASTAFVQQFVRGAIRSLGGSAANFPADFSNASTQTIVHSASGKDDNQGTVDSLVWAASQNHAQDAIGFTSGPTADKNRSVAHSLAYQHAGQTAAYWPDSSSDSYDKINIRNGHYFLWDTNQFFTKISGSNANPTLDQVSNADVKAFIGYFNGQLPSPSDADVTRAVIATGSIPQCAMQVQRSSDFSGLSCYAPTDPCGCYFESIATGTPTCDACDTDDQCSGSSKCHFHFCEAY